MIHQFHPPHYHQIHFLKRYYRASLIYIYVYIYIYIYIYKISLEEIFQVKGQLERQPLINHMNRTTFLSSFFLLSKQLFSVILWLSS